MSEHQARKRFGQNFLQDEYIIHNIIRAINPQKEDLVIEIGPGLAAITQPLTEHLNTLHVIEIDRDIIKRLHTLPFAKQLIIHSSDVLQFDFSQIAGKKTIVGNLPYNISTPLLFKLTQYIDEIQAMYFMLQKEVVERMIASPNSKNYGRLSVMLQYFFDMSHLFDVPPSAFKPAPKVDSAIVYMKPNIGRIGLVHNPEHFAQLISQAFAMRRKTIRNNLKNHVSEEDFSQLDIDPNLRAENISPEKYVLLCNFLDEKTDFKR